MAWGAKATPRYLRSRKKLSPAIRKALNKAQAQVIRDPYRGDRKRPPLGWLWVEKFRAENDQWLLDYEIDDKRDLVIFHTIGRHENFCRDVRRHRTRSLMSAAGKSSIRWTAADIRTMREGR